MGIQCEINISKSDGNFNAGSLLYGTIKYNINEDLSFEKITVSLKGNGYLFIKYRPRGSNLYTKRKHEEYVNIGYIIYKNEGNEKLPQGSYEKEFNFIVPDNIPPTLKYSKKTPNKLIHCRIVYCIRMEFQVNGIVNKVKKFRKYVNIISVVKARLPTEPAAYGEQKTLFQLSRKKNILKLNAVVDKSVAMPEDKIKIDYEIINGTNFNIKSVVVRLLEVYKFNAGKVVTINEEVEDTALRTGLIAHGVTVSRSGEIVVPEHLNSIEYSNLMSREYFIVIIVELPKHRRDVVFKIPIQITSDRPPPAYWQVLQECNDLEQTDDDFDDESSNEETTSL